MFLIAKIKKMVEALLDYVQKDFQAMPENQTFLYDMFYGYRDGDFDFYEQAKKIFLRTNDSPRKITVSMEYPKDRNHIPCIVIREPERSTPIPEGLGGFGEPPEDDYVNGITGRQGYRKPQSSSVNIMCFTDNVLESILVAEVLYNLLLGARNTFEEEFYGFDFHMSELIAENQVFPQPMIIKNIVIDVQWMHRYGSLISQLIPKRVVFEEPIPIDPETGPRDFVGMPVLWDTHYDMWYMPSVVVLWTDR